MRAEAKRLRLWLPAALALALLLIAAGLSASSATNGAPGTSPLPSSVPAVRPSIVALLSGESTTIEPETNPDSNYDFRANLRAAQVSFSNRGRPRPGASFESGNALLAFSLQTTDDSRVTQTTPNKIEFGLNGGAKVRYTATGDQVKEEIILSEPPQTGRFVFDYSESNLKRERSTNGGYRFLNDDEAEIFRMLPPSAADATGVKGEAELTIEGSELTLTVDRDFLMEATYPVTIDPTVVSTSGAATATAWPTQRKILSLTDDTLVTVFTGPPAQNANCGTGGANVDCGDAVYWARSTDDGTTWTSTATGAYGKVPSITRGVSNDLYLTYETVTSAAAGNGETMYRKGTYSAGPSYSWSARKFIGSSSTTEHAPTAVVDSAGVIHVVFSDNTVSGAKRNRVYWTYSADSGTTFCATPVDITLSPYVAQHTAGTFPSIVVDSNNDLYVTWDNGNGTFRVRRRTAGSLACSTANWGGSEWATFTNAGSPYSTTPNAMMFHSATIRPGGGQIAIVRPNRNTTTGMQYSLATSATGATASWTTTTGIDGSAAGDGYPSLAYHAGSYFAALKDSPSGYSNVALYRFQGRLKPKLTMFRDASSVNSYPTAMPVSNKDRLHIVWTSGSGSPYAVKYDYVPLPRMPTNLTQLAANHVDVIATGDTASDGATTNLYFDMSMDSSASNDVLIPNLEIRPLGTAFTGSTTDAGAPVDYSGSPVTGSIAVTGLTLDTSYHWQAWVSNATGDSVKVAYGSNPEASSDVTVASSMALSIDNTFNRDGTPGGGAVDFGSVPPDASPFLIHSDSGKHAVQLSVISNTAWDLTVASSGDLIDGVKTIPIGVLQWRSHASSDPWIPFDTSPSTILASQGPTAGTTIRHDYLLDISWDDLPGTYATTLTYTLQTP